MDLGPARRHLRALGGIALLAAAAFALHAALRHTPPAEVWASVRGIAPGAIAACLLLTAACYALLAGYDVLAWRHLGERPPLRRIAAASLVGYGLAHTLGASLVTGGLARDRLHASSPGRIAKVVMFCGVTSFIGYLAFSGLTLLAWPTAGEPLGVPAVASVAAGSVALLAVAAYLALAWRRPAPFAWRGHQISMPEPRVALGQTVLGLVEWSVAALALAPLLPERFPLPVMLAAFALAKTLAFFIHTPGGIGVFEAAMLSLAPAGIPLADVAAALVAYRALHFLLPFALAAGALGLHETLAHRRLRRNRHPATAVSGRT